MLLSAPITHISRCSLHDGPGLRTVVYSKGCPLRCRWCHNPETMEAHPDILFAPVKCIQCGRCAAVCPVHHRIEDGILRYDRTGCTACGRCAACCPTGALTVCGREMTVDEVYAEVIKDRHFYQESGGGVTLSGGECLCHPRFAAELLRRLRDEGVHTAIESAFCVPRLSVDQVLPHVDFIFADLKLPDAERHRRFTGRDNVQILDNLQYISETYAPVTLRIPLIPSVNDTLGDMDGFAAVIAGFGRGIKGVELLRYNILANAKYDSLGQPYSFFGEKAQSDTQLEALRERLQQGIPERIPVFFRRES